LIESEKTIIKTGQQQKEFRYYISSLGSPAEHFLQIIRGRRSIENKRHWSLDVTFHENLSTKQAGNVAENFGLITKIALNLLKNNTSKKTSIKNKRLPCALNNDFIAQTLFKKI